MIQPAHILFLRRARRRWILWRVVESAGISLAIGSALASAIVGIQAMWGTFSISSAAVIPVVAVASGMIWAINRRPTLTQAAILTDRQLKLHDLLCTALLTRDTDDQTFKGIVQKQADALCGSRSVNELWFRRLGARGWSGVGLLCSLLLVVSLMCNEIGLSATARPVDSADHLAEQSTAEYRVSQPIQPMAIAAAAPAQPNKKTEEYNSTAVKNTAQENDGKSDSSNKNPTRGNSSSRTNQDAIGDTQGQTNDAKVAAIEHLTKTSSETSPNGTAVVGGNQSASSTDIAESPQASENRPGASQPVKVVLPQSSSQPGLEKAGEPGSVNSKVEDRYREVLREYFSTGPKSDSR